MTTVQYMNRVARRSRTGDFTKLSLTEQIDVLQAMNAGLMRLYDAAPAYLKEQTQGFTLPAPVTLNNVSVTSGSTAMSTGLFTQAQIGATVLIPGDPAYNQVLGTATLRNPYNGPSGTVSGVTVYGDSLFSTSYPFDRIIGNPKFTNTGVVPLTPVEMSKSEGEWSYLFQNTVGRPQTWWIQFLGNAQGAQPLLVMKFAPYPDQAYSIKVRLAFWPMKLMLADLQAATTLNVPDQLLETALLPLAISELMTSPTWKSISKEDDDRVERRAAEALTFLRMQIADPSAPNNKIYTPLGY